MRTLEFGAYGVDLLEDGITVKTLYYGPSQQQRDLRGRFVGAVHAAHKSVANDVGQVNAKAGRWEKS